MPCSDCGSDTLEAKDGHLSRYFHCPKCGGLQAREFPAQE